MDIQTRDIGPCKKEVSVTVPSTDVDTELATAFEKVRTQVVFPGFRPGKAPMTMVERKFGDQVRADVTSELVEKSVREALTEQKLDVVSEPEFTGTPTPVESAKPFTFQFTVEVKPVFDVPAFKGLTIERKVKAVGDADIDRVIEDLRRKKAVVEPVSEGYAPGDFVLVNLEAKADGASIRTMRDVPIGGDEPEIPDFTIEGLPVALAGKKAGDSVTVDAELLIHNHGHDDDDGGEHDAHDHRHEHKDVELTITVNEIKRPRLPELNDEFARGFDKDDVASLRADVRKSLEAAHKAAADAEVEQGLLNKLVEATPFEMAQGPIDRALERRLRQRTAERMVRGDSRNKAEADVDAEKAEVRKIIERDARAWLIVERLAKKEKIFALEDDVTKEIERIARQHDVTPTDVRTHYEERHLMPELRAEIIERKVLDMLRANATITDVTDGAALGATA